MWTLVNLALKNHLKDWCVEGCFHATGCRGGGGGSHQVIHHEGSDLVRELIHWGLFD